jgi:hypothetical protein
VYAALGRPEDSARTPYRTASAGVGRRLTLVLGTAVLGPSWSWSVLGPGPSKVLGPRWQVTCERLRAWGQSIRTTTESGKREGSVRSGWSAVGQPSPRSRAWIRSIAPRCR